MRPTPFQYGNNNGWTNYTSPSGTIPLAPGMLGSSGSPGSLGSGNPMSNGISNFINGGFIPGIMSMFSSLSQTNPADAAMPYLDKLPGEISPYYQPWMDAGKGALGMLMGQLPNMLNNPGQFMNKMGQDFQKSPGYDFQLQQANQAGNNAAAAGGFVGSPQHQYDMQQRSSGLANQDYWNWMNHTLGLYGQGLNTGMGISGQGLQASSALAQNIADALMSQASLAYAGQANQNQSNGGLFGGMASLISNFF